MNSASLKDMFRRAEKWPTEDQDRLLEAASMIEQSQTSDFELTPEDLKILAERMKAAESGNFADEADVKAMFNKYRAK
ncbi:MAG TPA: hypothetical protein VIJ49_01575 [Aestuariivirga sp.]